MIVETLITTALTLLSNRKDRSPARQALKDDKARDRYDEKRANKMERHIKKMANNKLGDAADRLLTARKFKELDGHDLDILFPSTATKEEE